MERPEILSELEKEAIKRKYSIPKFCKLLREIFKNWIKFRSRDGRDYYFLNIDQKSLFPWMQEFASITKEELGNVYGD